MSDAHLVRLSRLVPNLSAAGGLVRSYLVAASQLLESVDAGHVDCECARVARVVARASGAAAVSHAAWVCTKPEQQANGRHSAHTTHNANARTKIRTSERVSTRAGTYRPPRPVHVVPRLSRRRCLCCRPSRLPPARSAEPHAAPTTVHAQRRGGTRAKTRQTAGEKKEDRVLIWAQDETHFMKPVTPLYR